MKIDELRNDLHKADESLRIQIMLLAGHLDALNQLLNALRDNQHWNDRPAINALLDAYLQTSEEILASAVTAMKELRP